MNEENNADDAREGLRAQMTRVAAPEGHAMESQEDRARGGEKTFSGGTQGCGRNASRQLLL
jgi:hypothetical protein